jgi:hypothetical protein
VRALEQLALGFDLCLPRWSLSRPALLSRHRQRILACLEFVRGFFPELGSSTIHVGLARKRGVLGWGSLDPEHPGVWVRPRRLEYFTIAHEFTHLLQARKLVPAGERACDLWALARSPLLIDSLPSYLALPRALRRQSSIGLTTAMRLHDAARQALAARAGGERRYLLSFEREIAQAFGAASRNGAR